MMTPNETTRTDANQLPENNTVAIVAIGAAAGGIEAMLQLLQSLPDKTGLAFIYIQHHESTPDRSLHTALSTIGNIKISEAEEGTPVEPDHLYILQPNKTLMLTGGAFTPVDGLSPLYPTMPINRFFSTLADNYKQKAIGVLLSGSISDGALGMRAIKMAGGFTLAQDETAQFHTMPKSAIAEGMVDRVLAPQEMAEELGKLSKQTGLFQKAINEMDEDLLPDRDENLLGILQLLLRSTGVDFGQYKLNTIKRRIIRRMMLHKIETAQAYLSYLRQNVNEVHFLYQDFLINVTSFFRDPETSDYLEKNLLPRIIQTKSLNDPVRVWIPACSTGQEAYSLAMLIIEALGENPLNIPVQIFATDLSETAVNKARLGMYTRDEVAGISAKRLQRFFGKPDGHYRVVKSIRDMCVFATHNIAKDPPFSRLDIISCCNLLIYLDTPLQKKVVVTFHYSLNNNGYLILGKSESIGTSTYLFSQADKKVKLFARKKDATSRAQFDVLHRMVEPDRFTPVGNRYSANKAKNEEVDLEEAVNNLLLKKFMPASVLVNYDLDILQFRGSTGLYLEPAPGKASLNLMKMAKPGLGFELRNIVHKAKNTGEATKKAGLELTVSGKVQRISIEAVPLKMDTEDAYFLVVFEIIVQAKSADDETGTGKDQQVKQLEAELTALREDMRSIVEAQEAANEELQSANEEIVSSNEELQSINEELETSKEEIESSNEELITINQELQIRNEQVAEAQEYSETMFTFVRESLLILDKELRVKTANAAFYKTFQVREEETEGCLIYDLGNRQWHIPQLRTLLENVVRNDAEIIGFEVTHRFDSIGEKTMLLNARKLIRKEHNQQLVLVIIEDITTFRQAQKIIADREAWFRNMADNAPVMIWVTGMDRLCNFVNQTFLQFRGISLNEAVGKAWTEAAHPDDLKRCLNIYNESFDAKQPFELIYRLKHKDGGYKTIFTKGKPNFTADGTFTGFIGSCVELDEKVKEAVG